MKFFKGVIVGTMFTVGTAMLYRESLKSKKRFTLSQFGLPEPELQEPEPDSVRYILAAIGLALIIAFAIRVYRKRRARA